MKIRALWWPLLVAVLATPAAIAHGGSDKAAVRVAGPRFDFEPPLPGTYKLPVIKQAADGQVLDSKGRTLSLREALAGRIALLSFIYTRCSDANGCPLATAVLHRIEQASRKNAALAGNLRLVSLSFDPAHDTPEVMARYHNPASPDGAEWVDLTTASEAALAPILAGYDVPVQKGVDATGKPGQVLGHQLRAYLVDRAGRVRNIYGLDFLDPRLLAADVLTLLAEERAGR